MRALPKGRPQAWATSSHQACQNAVKLYVVSPAGKKKCVSPLSLTPIEEAVKSYDAIYRNYVHSHYGVNFQCQALSAYEGCSKSVLQQSLHGYHEYRCVELLDTSPWILNEDDPETAHAICLSKAEIAQRVASLRLQEAQQQKKSVTEVKDAKILGRLGSCKDFFGNIGSKKSGSAAN